jgi:Predicted signal transduction protein with a C-terminal ATPase domain
MHVIDLIRNKLKWKLMIVISALILFVVTIIGTVSYWQTSRTIKRDVQRLSNQVLKQANLNLERYFKGYSQGFLLISLSPDLEKWLQVEKENMLDSVLYYQKINDVYVQPFLYQYPEILSLTLYNTNGNEISRTFRNGFKRNYKFTESGLDAFLNDNYTVDVRWSRDYLDYKGDEVEIPVITMVKKLRYGQHTGYLKIDIDLDPALRIVNELEIGDKGYGFISDSAGRIIAHPDESLITARMPEELIAGMGNRANGSFFREDTHEFVLFRSMDSSDWRTVVVVPYHEFASSIYFIRKFTAIVAAAALFCSILLAIGISASFTKRIARLRKIIKNTARGKFDVKADIGGTDEVAELGMAYNAMLEDLDNTVNALAETKVAQQKAILSALQSQIDSHFLYNTLESINSLAALSGHTQIEQTTIALSKMLRYTSDYKGTVVPVEDEIRHLSNYLDIMKIRMGDDLEYVLDIDSRCLSGFCLKAIMQPIVENSMKHTEVPMDTPLRVWITVGFAVYDNTEYLVIRVVDNGQGFRKEKLEEIAGHIRQINISPLHHQHANIGLLNIHFRLKMYYPHDTHTGIVLGNADRGSGAAVEIRFPFQTHAKQEVSADVLQRDHCG